MTLASGRTVTAIVLAGGRSARFGTDKLAHEIDGSPLLHHAIRAVAPLSDEVLVAGATDGLAVSLPAEFATRVAVLRDAEPDRGPLIALLAAAQVAKGDALLVVGGDMPELQPALLRRLLTWSDGDDGVCVVAEGWTQPLPIGLDRARTLAAGKGFQARGERSLRQLIGSLHLDELTEDAWRSIDPDGRSLRDIDTPADLDRAT
jgi:molybdopterin-guanine dinucleotide biosynthesis protein A